MIGPRVQIDFEELIGRKTLLYGETDTKKTFYTARFVQFLIERQKMPPNDISILDFAPPLIDINGVKIGGKVLDYYDRSRTCRYIKLNGEIIPPRLNARNKREMYENACKNFRLMSQCLESYEQDHTPVLIINDISLYLHIGNKNDIIKLINEAETFFGNAYHGESIKKEFTKVFSLKERKSVKFLIDRMDKSFFTDVFNIFLG